ncbi:MULTISPECIES: hypothetical protein [Streptomyces]
MHETVFEDDENVAFLDWWPSLPGKCSWRRKHMSNMPSGTWTRPPASG